MDYTPVLKWRQGEYQALFKLDESVKDYIKPLLVIPPIEYDFEEQRPKKTIQEHIETVPKRYLAKWKNRSSFIELHQSLIDQHMTDGRTVINFIISEVNKSAVLATPIVKLEYPKSHLDEIVSLVKGDTTGIAIRLQFQELMNSSVNASLDNMVKYFGKSYSDVDLIIDLGAPANFEPYNIFAKAISAAIKKVSDLINFKSFTILCHSLNLSTIKAPGGSVHRHEWELYKFLTHELKDVRAPSYSDYTIETPEFVSQDMRLLKPAGKIVYTTDKSWEIVKGKQFRGNEIQMVSHCKSIANAKFYYGHLYSIGDKKIFDTAFNGSSTGTLGTWKDVAINHHITVVVNQLATTLAVKT